jgi:hypothetical protein
MKNLVITTTLEDVAWIVETLQKEFCCLELQVRTNGPGSEVETYTFGQDYGELKFDGEKLTGYLVDEGEVWIDLREVIYAGYPGGVEFGFLSEDEFREMLGAGATRGEKSGPKLQVVK